jgi:hypothetical protein
MGTPSYGPSRGIAWTHFFLHWKKNCSTLILQVTYTSVSGSCRSHTFLHFVSSYGSEYACLPVDAQATKPEETSVTSPEPQITSVTSPVSDEPTPVSDPVVSRVTSIILQPPAMAVSRNVSTPIFTHLGQQVTSNPPWWCLHPAIQALDTPSMQMSLT